MVIARRGGENKSGSGRPEYLVRIRMGTLLVGVARCPDPP